MQIFFYLLRVIFMLSTIVYVTDCCSSRMLLLREHTLKFVRDQQQHFQQHSSLPSTPSMQEKLPQHVDIVTNALLEFSQNLSIEIRLQQERKEVDNTTTEANEADITTEQPDSYTNDMATTSPESVVEKTAILFNTTERTMTTLLAMKNVQRQDPEPPDGAASVPDSLVGITLNSSDFITDPAIRAKHAGNPKYHVIDFYYTIMRDVLSFECIGQFLTDFCLNGGRCFRYPIGNTSFFSCECADGFVGERCESKSVNGFYQSTSILAANAQRPKILMARFVFTFPMLIIFSTAYLLIACIIVFKCPKNRAAGLLVC